MTPRLRLDDDALRRAAWVVVAATFALAAVVVAMLLVVVDRTTVQTASYADLVVGTTWPFAGALVLQAQPRNVCGWLLQAAGLLLVQELFGMYSLWSRFVAESPLPGAPVADSVATWGYTVFMVVVPLLAVYFPDGRLPSPRWRPFAWSVLASAAVLTVASAFVDRALPSFAGVPNPLSVEPGSLRDALVAVVVATSFYSALVGTGAPVVSMVVRARRTGDPTWLWLGVPIGVLGLVGGLVLVGVPYGREAFTVALLGPPVGIAVSIVRHRLFEVEFVLRRSLVLAVVVVVVGGGWVLAVLGLDPATWGTRVGAVAIVVLALLSVVLTGLVQRLVDRWFFPHRLGSVRLAPRIAAAVAESSEPRGALDALVAATRTQLGLPYAAFVGDVAAVDGRRPDEVEQIPAQALGRRVGFLEVAPRVRSEPFSVDERALLDQVASQAAVLAHAAVLVAEVEQSRAAIVTSREEERRRLRNDLHDGVGPTLAAIALQADALTSRLAGVAGGAEAQAIRDRLREAVAQVRAVSHGLRPPVLDQLGLAASLEQMVQSLGPVAGRAHVDDLTGLPAATEVAVYSIAAEAVNNAVTHSAASSLRLEVDRRDDRVVLRVADNGRGMPARPAAGVGLTSMRQRALEVGGRVDHAPAPGGGTVVTLTLPLSPREAALS